MTASELLHAYLMEYGGDVDYDLFEAIVKENDMLKDKLESLTARLEALERSYYGKHT